MSDNQVFIRAHEGPAIQEATGQGTESPGPMIQNSMSIKKEQSSVTQMDYPKWITRDVFKVKNGFSNSSPPSRRATRSPRLDCDGEPVEANLQGDAPSSQVAPEGQSGATQVPVESNQDPVAGYPIQVPIEGKPRPSEGIPRKVPWRTNKYWETQSGQRCVQKGCSGKFPSPRYTQGSLRKSVYDRNCFFWKVPKVHPGMVSPKVSRLRPELFSLKVHRLHPKSGL